MENIQPTFKLLIPVHSIISSVPLNPMSITIVNDTSDPWHCKINKNVPALRWQSIAPSVLASVTAALAISPALTTGGGGGAVFGVPADFMKIVGITVDAGVSVSGPGSKEATSKIGAAISGAVVNAIKSQDYAAIMPGKRKVFTQLGNSKQQVDCKRILTSRTLAQVTINTLWMNDIATGDNDNYHALQKWIDQTKLSADVIDPHSGPARAPQQLRH